MPRSLITMNMELEKKVFESFLATLSMLEKVDDAMETTVVLTLGELRQHVQWCQYAAQLVDTAEQVNKEFARLQVKLIRTNRIVERWRDQERMLEDINSRMNNLKGRINDYNASRNKVKAELQRHAKTDD